MSHAVWPAIFEMVGSQLFNQTVLVFHINFINVLNTYIQATNIFSCQSNNKFNITVQNLYD